MIYFRQIILNQIKSAASETEIDELVDNSIHLLKVKNVNGHIIQRFISGMSHDLGRELALQLSPEMTKNIDRAIALFRGLQRP